jgi:D-threo-aldose 1-dehydrogenase
VNELETRVIGRTSLHITCLGLGGGALGGLYEPVAADDAIEAVEQAYEHGIRYFDAAPLYGHGRSEERLGRGLAGVERSSFVLSTKVGMMIDPRPSTEPGAERRYADPFLLDGRFDFSYDACLRSLEASMRRLRTDRVDIVYIHDPDEGDSLAPPDRRTGKDHLAEAMDGAYRALDELRAQGVIGAIGVGLNGTSMLVRFAHAGDFDCFLLAGRYTLLEQNGLDDLLPLCVERGISVVVGGVFNSGILATGTSGSDPTYNYEPAGAETLARVAAIERACGEYGVPLAAAALQFPLAHPAVAAVLPGARSAGEVRGNVAAVNAQIPSGLWETMRMRALVNPLAPLSTRARGELHDGCRPELGPRGRS